MKRVRIYFNTGSIKQFLNDFIAKDRWIKNNVVVRKTNVMPKYYTYLSEKAMKRLIEYKENNHEYDYLWIKEFSSKKRIFLII